MVIDADDCLRNPVVVVEVLSPSTQGYDRGEKFRLYRQLSSLRHYLVVAQDRILVEKYVHHDGDLWALAETYTSIDDVVRLEELDVEISVSQIYERARFQEGV
jgi:Uma2 family endonuclease